MRASRDRGGNERAGSKWVTEIAASTEIKGPRWNDKEEAAGEKEKEPSKKPSSREKNRTPAVYQWQQETQKIPPLSSELPVLYCICHHREHR